MDSEDDVNAVEQHSDKPYSAGAVERKCSKCGLPCRGHVGPYGRLCTVASDDGATAHNEDQVVEGPQQVNSDALLSQLISQMTALNVNMQSIIEEQKSIRHAVSISGEVHHPNSPPVLRTSPDSGLVGSDISARDKIPSATTVSLPGGARISEKTANSARRGEFINLSEFLPVGDYVISDRQVEPMLGVDGKLEFRTKKSSRSIDSVTQWCLAWNNYEHLVVSNNSARYSEMSKYRDFIQKCAQKFQWCSVHAYNCRFDPKLHTIKLITWRRLIRISTLRYLM